MENSRSRASTSTASVSGSKPKGPVTGAQAAPRDGDEARLPAWKVKSASYAAGLLTSSAESRGEMADEPPLVVRAGAGPKDRVASESSESAVANAEDGERPNTVFSEGRS